MLSVHKVKRNLLRRFWFNKTQIFDDGSIHKARRHGLRYGDVRGHCLVKLSHVGQMELMEVPYDEMAEWRLDCKKRSKADTRAQNRVIRQIRQGREKPLVGVSFHQDRVNYNKRQYLKYLEENSQSTVIFLEPHPSVRRAVKPWIAPSENLGTAFKKD